MKPLILLCVLFLSACSVHIVDMADGPTEQKFNLVDLEGDGVIRARDECPTSSGGAQVNNSGCGSETIETVRRKLEVHFDTNSYVVKGEFLPEIKKLADFMIQFPETVVTIEGHTSIRGKAKFNQELSEKRANAIKNILQKQFLISAERITAIGFGFEKLLLEGDDEYIHGRNRRIVAEISLDKTLIDMKWHIYTVDDEIE